MRAAMAAVEGHSPTGHAPCSRTISRDLEAVLRLFRNEQFRQCCCELGADVAFHCDALLSEPVRVGAAWAEELEDLVILGSGRRGSTAVSMGAALSDSVVGASRVFGDHGDGRHAYLAGGDDDVQGYHPIRRVCRLCS